MTPFIATLSIYISSKFPIGVMLDPNIVEFSAYLKLLLVFESLQVLFGLFMFFVHDFEGFEFNRDCWIKVGPWVHHFLAASNFVIVPLVSFIIYCKWDKLNNKTVFGPVFKFFLCLSIINLVFYLVGNPRVGLGPMQYLEQGRAESIKRRRMRLMI